MTNKHTLISIFIALLATSVCVIVNGFAFGIPGSNRWLTGSYSRNSMRLQDTVRRSGTNRDKRLIKIMESIEQERVQAVPEFSLYEDPLMPMVETIVKAADSRKATEISAFRVFHLTEVTSFMVLVVGNSKPQNQAIANAVQVGNSYKLCCIVVFEFVTVLTLR